jgi:hypothetical protein
MVVAMNRFKGSILNTMLMFNRIFNKNKPLSEGSNFEIKEIIKTTMGVKI